MVGTIGDKASIYKMSALRLKAWLLLCLCYLLITCLKRQPGVAAGQIVQPIQFCKTGRKVESATRQDTSPRSIEFCTAIVPYRNISSGFTDLYVTIRRNEASLRDNGWLGIGIGTTMKGALMMILFDDVDDSTQSVKASIRQGLAHIEPIELLDRDPASGEGDATDKFDARVMESNSEGDEEDIVVSEEPVSATAQSTTIKIVIYAVEMWHGTTINPSSPAQPWIWAQGPPSEAWSDSRRLRVHAPEKDSGYGFFWTDFASHPPLTSPSPSFPSIDQDRLLHHSTVMPPTVYRLGGPSVRNWMFHLHGGLASLAFLVLYPLGALLLRTSDPRAFNFHWTTQSFASILLLLGAIIGWMLSRRFELTHQFIGLLTVGCIWLQLFLGWRHHVSSFRTKFGISGWLGTLHVWTGRTILLTGWVNLLLGLKARDYSILTLVATGGTIFLEAFVMFRILWMRNSLPLPRMLRWTDASKLSLSRRRQQPEPFSEEYFELVEEEDEDDNDNDDDDYDEDGRLKSDVRWEAEQQQQQQQQQQNNHNHNKNKNNRTNPVAAEEGVLSDEEEELRAITSAKLKKLDVV